MEPRCRCSSAAQLVAISAVVTCLAFWPSFSKRNFEPSLRFSNPAGAVDRSDAIAKDDTVELPSASRPPRPVPSSPAATASRTAASTVSATISPAASSSSHPQPERSLVAAKLEYFKECLARTVSSACRPSAEQLASFTSTSVVLSRDQWRAHAREVLEGTKPLRSISVHEFGYFGPWIENHFISEWAPGGAPGVYDLDKIERAFYPLVPLLVQWTDGHFGRDVISKQLEDLLNYMKAPDGSAPPGGSSPLRSDVMYVTITQHDYGAPAKALTCEKYRNVLVLSSGGWGSVGLPLIKGEWHIHRPNDATAVLARPRKHLFTFIGAIHRSRYQLPRNFRNRSTLPASLINIGEGGWFDIAAESVFLMAPRGFGRNSFRLSELVQAGSIPIVVGDDIPWVPYQDYAELLPAGDRPWDKGSNSGSNSFRAWANDTGDPAARVPVPKELQSAGALGPYARRGAAPSDVRVTGSGDASGSALNGGVLRQMWGPMGIGFAITYDSIAAFTCKACDFFRPGSAERYKKVARIEFPRGNVSDFSPSECPCVPSEWEKLNRELRKGDPSAPFTLPPDSLVAVMEQRVRDSRDMFTYPGVIRRVAQWVKDPWHAELACAAKPAHYGNAE